MGGITTLYNPNGTGFAHLIYNTDQRDKYIVACLKNEQAG